MTDAIQSLPQERMAVPMPDWGGDYLEALDKAQGSHSKAARILGKSYDQIYRARQKCERLAREIEEIKERWRSFHLAELEDVSMAQAMKPGCTTERIFRMKQLDPSYRDRQQGLQIGGITVNWGFTMSGATKEMEIPAKVLATNDILSDADLEF